MKKFKIVIATSIVGAFLFNSGCALPILYVAMEVTGANRYYKLVDEADKKRKAREDELERKLVKIDYDVEAQKQGLLQTYNETSKVLRDYSGEKNNLDELTSLLDSLRKGVILPNISAREDYERAKVLDNLYYTLKRVVDIRNSFGNYIEVYSGNYFTAHRNESNIRRSIPELKSMKSRLEQYKNELYVSELLKEIDQTLKVAERYADSIK